MTFRRLPAPGASLRDAYISNAGAGQVTSSSPLRDPKRERAAREQGANLLNREARFFVLDAVPPSRETSFSSTPRNNTNFYT